MKYLVISDIHGSAPAAQALNQQVEQENPDRILLLGDLLYHGPRNNLPEGYAPKKVISILNSWSDRVIAIRGNCDAEVDQMVLDFPCMADYALIESKGQVMYASHGHLCHKSPADPPHLAAGSIFLSGHTHIKTLNQRHGILFLNPGSPSLPKDGLASFAVCEPTFCSLKTLKGTTIKKFNR